VKCVTVKCVTVKYTACDKRKAPVFRDNANMCTIRWAASSRNTVFGKENMSVEGGGDVMYCPIGSEI